jgi:peptidoglycan/LPS O-acetylase OafA/YrhL
LKERRLKEIDGFRAIAVMIVILSHLGVNASPGQTGVLLFFVISGYVITSSITREYGRSNNFSLKNFLKRRALKILPPLFLIVILPSMLFGKEIGLPALISQILFFFNWQYLNTSAGILPGSQVVWSLSVEEQYYIFIALAVALFIQYQRIHIIRFLVSLYLLLFCFAFFSRLIVFYSSNDQNAFGDIPRILYGTDTRMSSIAVGGLFSLYVNSNTFSANHKKYFERYKFSIYILLIVMGIFSVMLRNEFFRNTFKYTTQELVCACLILLVSDSARNFTFVSFVLRGKLVQSIGKASYCIYLSHLIIIVQVREFLKLSDSPVPIIIESTLLFFIVLFVGGLLHLIVDKPFEKIRNSLR